MTITITNQIKSLRDATLVAVSFTVFILEETDGNNLSWPYTLTTAEVNQVAQDATVLDNIVLRESKSALTAYESQIAGPPKPEVDPDYQIDVGPDNSLSVGKQVSPPIKASPQ